MFTSKYSTRTRKPINLGGPSRTKQSFKNETDINLIMARYVKTGQLPALVKQNPKYGDFSTVPDYQTALDTVMRAEEAFAALPAKVRKACDNDPAVFLDRVTDPEFVKTHEDALRGVVTIPETTKPRPTPPSQPAAKTAEAAEAT